MKKFTVSATVLFATLALCGASLAQNTRPPLLREVGIDPRPDSQIPLDLFFHDETGGTVRLGDYFRGKPVILTLVYYDCPMLCTEVLNGLSRGMQGIPLDVGKEFGVVTVSINPRETPATAALRKRVYAGLYGRPSAEEGWHFLTGSESQIAPLAHAVGFRYAYDPETGDYGHVAAIMVLTPQGKVSRYLYGVQYAPRDLRLALVEASQGKIGTLTDQLLLFCYHYDPNVGKYGVAILNVMRLGGIVTMIGIAFLIFVLSRRAGISRHSGVV